MSLALAGYSVLALVAVALSGLFSGMETGLYTLNRVRLAVRAARGQPAALRVRRELQNQGRMLSTLLIGTNAASYLASFALAAILHQAGLDDWPLIALEAALLTPVLFVFAETLPKDLFRTHTDAWTYRLSRVMTLARWAFTVCLLLPLVQGVATVVSRLMGARPDEAATARQRISQLIMEGAGTGVLSESQTTLADRALDLRARTVAAEMIPWRSAATVPLGADTEMRTAIIRRRTATRMPVLDASGRVVGILSTLDALLDPDRPTEQLMTEPLSIPADTPVRQALSLMRTGRQAMAIAVDPAGRPRGLVTLKDLVEPITGELATW